MTHGCEVLGRGVSTLCAVRDRLCAPNAGILHVVAGGRLSQSFTRPSFCAGDREIPNGTVKHGKKEYAHYDYRTGQTFHVNTVEGFWRLFKASVRSTHIQISAKHMDRYLSEFTFRANNRHRVNGMFDLLVGAL